MLGGLEAWELRVDSIRAEIISDALEAAAAAAEPDGELAAVEGAGAPLEAVAAPEPAAEPEAQSEGGVEDGGVAEGTPHTSPSPDTTLMLQFHQLLATVDDLRPAAVKQATLIAVRQWV